MDSGEEPDELEFTTNTTNKHNNKHQIVMCEPECEYESECELLNMSDPTNQPCCEWSIFRALNIGEFEPEAAAPPGAERSASWGEEYSSGSPPDIVIDVVKDDIELTIEVFVRDMRALLIVVWLRLWLWLRLLIECYVFVCIRRDKEGRDEKKKMEDELRKTRREYD